MVGNVIIMNPQNGNILSMATYPDYNLNEPFTPNNSISKKNWNKLDSSGKSDFLYKMWTNTAVQSTYEPGSTFKLITAAAALEEDLITLNHAGDFHCSGYQVVSGITINCWKKDGSHGSQSLTQALGNSCNPAFMQLGKKVGATTLYKYYEAFGLFNKTGSGLYGESSSVFHNLEKVGSVELATMSFGQRFNITPLQLITAVSSIANERCINET